MIARLKGILEEVGEDWIVIDVSGVGYLVFCPGRVISNLPAVGAPLSLHIETHVREDHIQLYGFATANERAAFRMLMTVQGVGSKVGLAILGTLSVDELTAAIIAQDKAMLSRPDGVGPRLASRLVTELKDKIVSLGGAFSPAARPAPGGDVSTGVAAAETDDGLAGDAVSALVNLGYGRAEALTAVTRAMQDGGDEAGLGALIRAALKDLSQ